MALPKGDVAKVLMMDDAQLKRFLSSLSPSALEYLELILNKAEEDLEK